MATDKVRTRLTRLLTQRKKIQAQRADNDDRLKAGAALLETQLDLLTQTQELYRRLSDHGRRLLNQAVFDEVLVDQDRDDLAIRAVGPSGRRADLHRTHAGPHDLRAGLPEPHRLRPYSKKAGPP